MIKREVAEKGKKVKLTFVQPFQASDSPISVVGDFNDWDPNKNKMVKRANGTASTSVTVEPNQRIRFRYRRADGTWFNDEAADAYEVGEAGAENCVVMS
jgi:1,4-alpha-glucan branching enzyme